MRKSTQQKIMVAFIIITFSLSSLAFFFQPKDTTQEIQSITNFVMDGQLDKKTENHYVKNGFTSLKFFYSDASLMDYMDQLPEITSTNLNQVQLIVQKIRANETYLVIYNNKGEEEIRNVTKGRIFSALCDLLTITPLECGLFNRTE